MMKNLAEISYHFLLEFILGLLLIFFFFIQLNQLPPLLTIFFLCFSGFLLMIFLLAKFKNAGKWMFLCIIYPLFIWAGIQLGFSVYISCFFGIYIFIRGISLSADFTGHSSTLLLFISFITGLLLIIYSGASHYPFQSIIISLLIFQVLLVLIGEFFAKWQTIKEDRLKFIFYYSAILGGTAVIGSIITLSIKIFKTIFFGLMFLLVKIFSLLSIPIFAGLGFVFRLFGNGERKVQKIKVAANHGSETIQKHAAASSNWWMLVILFLIAAWLIYYFYKKRTPFLQMESSGSLSEVSEVDFKESGGIFFKKRVKPPADFVRREIFQLEKFAGKLKLGRNPAETLDEWWARVGLTETKAIKKIYENIRYGEIPATPEEITNVKEIITGFKEHLKETARQNKDNPTLDP